MVHELKCWPHAFDAIVRGAKTFELRRNIDRDFDVGDELVLMKWDPSDGGVYVFTNPRGWVRDIEQIRVRVTYVLHGGRFGLPSGLCVMSIEKVEEP